jgi:acetoacetyl-CoA synthetase
MQVEEGRLLWEPSEQRRAQSVASRYLAWLRDSRGVEVDGPRALWRWSVADLDAFWLSVWDFCEVIGTRGETAVADDAMPGARWFPGASLNYAENALRRTGAGAAVIARREDGRARTLSWDQLREAVARAAAGLRRLGVGPGDRVCAVLPNSEHALVAFLATAAIGAVWSSCSPDFGHTSLVDRFSQIEPTVLVGIDGYVWNGREIRILDRLATLEEQLPTLKATVLVGYLDAAPDAGGLRSALSWDELLAEPAPLVFTRVPFETPLWILYSSGTTGLPKPIVQGHGGIVLEHAKSLALHCDLGPGDRFYWFTTTGWMMWNFLVSGLIVGSTVVCYDGSPAHPDLGVLWRLAAAEGLTLFGTSAPFLTSCMNAGVVPRELADLSALRTIGSTGSPLSPEGFAWVYEAVSDDLLLASVSGGTDVCTAFAGGLPLLPVHAGELQTPFLGCDLAAYDEAGEAVIGEVGELVVRRPLPSMPLFFWGDRDGSRLRESYFSAFPGVWRHGDWVKVTDRGSVVIYGRSDATLNRGGVRVGTAEFYRVLEEIPGLADSLIVDTGRLGTEGKLILFVVPAPGRILDDAMRREIAAKLRSELSPRHVPDQVVAVPEVPKTLNGKKLEVPVKRLLAGEPLEKAVSAGAVANPDSLSAFLDVQIE